VLELVRNNIIRMILQTPVMNVQTNVMSALVEMSVPNAQQALISTNYILIQLKLGVIQSAPEDQ
jgi:hypothetical protein